MGIRDPVEGDLAAHRPGIAAGIPASSVSRLISSRIRRALAIPSATWE